MQLVPGSGFALDIKLAPYGGATANLRIPEGIGAVASNPAPHRVIHAGLPGQGSFKKGQDGWWALSTDVQGIGHTSRLRLNEQGDRIDIQLIATNNTGSNWARAEYGPCLAMPEPFEDYEMQRTFVVDGDGRLRSLGDLVDHYDVNICTLKDGPDYLRHPVLSVRWRTQDVKLGAPVIIREAKDGRYALITAYERAWAVATGFHGPCIHSDAMTLPLRPGESDTVRGFVALIEGKADTALAFYRQWKTTH